MTPQSATPARVDGWRRAFVEAGIRWIEPVFAGLMEAPEDVCWGVLYKLNDADAARLDRFEGPGYARVRVTATCAQHGDVDAFAYASPHPIWGRKPSRRYLNLLIEGAVERGLPETAIDSLRAEPSSHIPLVSSLVALTAELLERNARR